MGAICCPYCWCMDCRGCDPTSLSVYKGRSQTVKVPNISNISALSLSLSLSLSVCFSFWSLMEWTEAEYERRRRRAAKLKEVMPSHPRRALPAPTTTLVRAPSTSEVKLAAIAIDLNVRLRAADMPASMQERAFRYTRALLDANTQEKRPNPTHLAMSLKKVS